MHQPEGITIELEEPAVVAIDDRRRGAVVPLLAAAALGAAVSVSLGVYGRRHDPTNDQLAHWGFSSMIAMKAWLATGAFALGIAQLLSAMWMWGKLPGVGAPPRWIAHAHRWTGTAAFLLSLPVAYHCLWSLGFQDHETRVLLHGLFGCAFYGAITVKLLALRIDGLRGWVLPVLGGSLVALLTAIWLTSSLWYFDHFGFPGF